MEVLDKLNRGLLHIWKGVVEKSDKSGDEAHKSRDLCKLLSKKTFRMKKVYGTSDPGMFFVTRPRDAANKPSLFFFRVCRKDVSVIHHGHRESVRHFQGARHFSRDQCLRFDLPGWRVSDFHGNPLNTTELERWKSNFNKSFLVLRDREHPFAEDPVVDGASVADPMLPMLARVPCLVDVLKVGGSYALEEKLSSQFVLTSQHWSSLNASRSCGRFHKCPEVTPFHSRFTLLLWC